MSTEATTSRFAELPSARLHYNEMGDGDVVIMLHGGGPGAAGWSNFAGNIEAFAKRYRVLLVDMPGFGKSAKPYYEEGQGTFSARCILELMDHLNIEKAHFVGNSLGAHAAMCLALSHPERTADLILMAPALSVGFVMPWPTEGAKALRGYYHGEGPSLERMRDFISKLVYDSTLVTDEVVRMRYEASIVPEVAEWARTMGPRAGRIEPIWNRFNEISNRTLLVWGRDDTVVPLDRALFMVQQMPNVRLHIFAHCGHWAMVERADEFNRLCRDFLDHS